MSFMPKPIGEIVEAFISCRYCNIFGLVSAIERDNAYLECAEVEIDYRKGLMKDSVFQMTAGRVCFRPASFSLCTHIRLENLNAGGKLLVNYTVTFS